MIQKLMSANFLLLSLIISISIVLRFSYFNQSPPALNWDEASLGYNAFSILKTGKDEWGRVMPLTFEAFGDYKLPGYIYLAVPFVAILDLNEVSVRLPSMISGVLAVLFLYLTILDLSRNRFWALSSAFLLAISPMSVFLSRAALEANLALCLFMGGLLCAVKGIKKPYLLVIASIMFGLTLFTYNSARVFIPLFLAALTVFNFTWIKSHWKLFIVPTIIISIFFISASFLALTQDSASRYYWVTILDEGAVNSINQSRGDSTYGPIITKIVYNRYSYFITHLVSNYFSHFSPKFLLFEGGSNYQFSIPKNGVIYFIEFPLLVIGLFKIMKNKTWAIIFLAWILIAPIPAAITRESPHVLRSIFLLGGLQALAGYGFVQIWGNLKGKFSKPRIVVIAAILILLVGQSATYFNKLFFEYPEKYSQSWQYGYKQAIQFVLSKENLDQRPLFISKKYGEPHIFYLFYSKYDPAKYQNNTNLTRYARSNWRWVDRIDNVYFINDWEVKEKIKNEHGYLISTEKNYPGIPSVLKTINFLDSSIAFEIVEI